MLKLESMSIFGIRQPFQCKFFSFQTYVFFTFKLMSVISKKVLKGRQKTSYVITIFEK